MINDRFNRLKATLLTGVSAMTLALALSGAAHGEESKASGDGATGLVLEEITVTARKGEVSLQNALVAVSVVSGQNLDDNNVSRLDDFNGFVPGLNITKNDGAGRVVSIRGVGWETAQNLSTQPGVLFYIDGVYVANPLAIGMDLGDLERVEVFRGPQGTEFGQNTTGGAINVVTKKPELGVTSGGAELSLGTYNLTKARAHVNVPLGDTLAVRASIQKFDRDGFATATEVPGTPDYELDDANSITGKLAFMWQPKENFSVLLTGFWQDSDQHGSGMKSINDPVADPRILTQDFPGTFELFNSQYSAIVNWELPIGTLKSLTSYQYLKKKQTVDGDRLDFATLGGFDNLTLWDNNSKAFTQEINLSSNNDGPVQWLVGGYYLWHENFQDILEVGTSGFNGLIFQTTDSLTRKDTAVYGQFTWAITDNISFTGGGRYQNDKTTSEVTIFFTPKPTATNEDSAFTWKAGLDIELSSNNALYFLASTGYRNGGNNGGSRNAEVVPFNFKPETVRAYEIGSKNKFFDERVRLNLAAFYYDYSDYQFIAEDVFPFQGGAGNIPGAKIYGVEAEFSWLISESLRLDGFAAAIDGEFTEDFLALDVVDVAAAGANFDFSGVTRRPLLKNLKGNEPAKLVNFTGRISLTHFMDLGDKGTLTSRVDYVYRGDFQYRVFNNPAVDTVPSYSVVNLHFRYEPSDSMFSFALSASNLLDTDGVNSRYTNPYGSYSTSEEFIAPQEVIGSIKVRF